MKTPASILPSRPQGPVSPRPAAPPPEPTPPDESILDGLRRRLGEVPVHLQRPEDAVAWTLIGLLTAGLIYSYWPGLMNAQSSWNDGQYSHGGLVPLISLLLLFWWRQPMEPVAISARLAGLGLIAGSFAFRLACAKLRIITLDMYTFVPALAGVFLMVGGWKTFRWSWAPIAVLIFMFPLPEDANGLLLFRMQRWATTASTFALQTLGVEAYQEGNKILLGDSQVLGVVDACSGLRMLTIFVWLSIIIVLVAGGAWWENLLLIAGSFVIALFVNVIRITVTGVTYTISPAMAEKIFHDWAGYFMMPLALGMLAGLQQVLSRLVVEEEVAPAAIVRTRPQGLGPAVVSPAAAGGKSAEKRAGPDAGAPRGPFWGT